MSEKSIEIPGNITRLAAAGADQVVRAEPCTLRGILVGKVVAAGTIEVSDHASDGDGNVLIMLTGAPVGLIPMNVVMRNGITCDLLVSQTDVHILWD